MNGFFDYLEEKTKDRHITGVTTAIVTNNQDPSGLGRVKVKFYWNGEEGETNWARVAYPMAGKGKGMFFVPEVGDEVLVAFEMGDINRPYIVGVLWNGKDMPPESNPNIKKISSSNGHEITMNDETDSIQIRTSSGDEITVENGKRVLIKSGDTSLELNRETQDIKISSSLSLSIEATQIKIKGTNVEIKADAVLTLQGSLVRIN